MPRQHHDGALFRTLLLCGAMLTFTANRVLASGSNASAMPPVIVQLSKSNYTAGIATRQLQTGGDPCAGGAAVIIGGADATVGGAEATIHHPVCWPKDYKCGVNY
jgi:hypothetical protein